MNSESADEIAPQDDLSLFSERLAGLIGAMPVAKYARECGVNESALRSYLAGRSEPGMFNLRKIAGHSGRSMDWLCEMRSAYPPPVSTVLATGDGIVRNAAEFRGAVSDEYVEIPLYDIAASMGNGAWNDSARVKSRLAFRRDWLTATVGGTTGLSLVTGIGDSMFPTIPDSAVVMVQDVVDHWFADGIYFMRLNGGHVIKRVQRKGLRGIEGGRTELVVSVRSDNEAYEPVEVVLRDETLHETTVLARAVWYGVKLP